MKFFFAITLFLFTLSGCRNRTTSKNAIIRISAAAGFREVLDMAVHEFEEGSETKVQINYGGTGTLARQLEQGAQADIFLAANVKWMQYVLNRELADTTTFTPIAKNRLVFVTPVNSTIDTILIDENLDLASLFSGRLAIGDSMFVPAGQYAVQALRNLNQLEALKSRLAPSRDVRSTLALVELGETELGIVYASMVHHTDKIRLVGILPKSTHDPIIFSGCLLSASPNRAVLSFWEYLLNPKNCHLWEKFGFELCN